MYTNSLFAFATDVNTSSLNAIGLEEYTVTDVAPGLASAILFTAATNPCVVVI